MTPKTVQHGRGSLIRAWNLVAETTIDVNNLLGRARTAVPTRTVVDTRRHLLELTAKISMAIKAPTPQDAATQIENLGSVLGKLSRGLGALAAVPEIDSNRLEVITNRLGEIKKLLFV
ncbi:MAG: hypothetical protein C4523_09860 [Myxococcales bacterium]|nr:MAG: hypothetical protein C4523_09860 [Myxococcales bacterium]